MRSRRFIVGMIAIAVALTGFMGYTFNLTSSPDDWHDHGLYIDQIRPYWWPVFLSLVALLIVAVYTSSTTDEDDKTRSVLN